MEGHGRLFWTAISPLATSWASAPPADTTLNTAATISILIIFSPVTGAQIEVLGRPIPPHCRAGAVQAAPTQRVNGLIATWCTMQARCRCAGLGGFSRYNDRGNAGEVPMPVLMPLFDQAVLARRAEIVAALARIVPGEGVIASERAMRPFESDGLTAYRQLPMVVVLPETTAQVAAVLGYCHAHGIKVVPRGAGTSLSGGALPLGDGVLLGMAKFNRIRDIDFDNRVAVVEPGGTNLAVSQAVEEAGFYYAPDPSSQIACTIGGNVAENSGGVHCLKYGMTTNNLLGCELVLMTGETVRLGGRHLDSGGYDLLGVVTGSEGLLGVVTEVTVRILKRPQRARAALIGFPASEDGGECVAKI